MAPPVATAVAAAAGLVARTVRLDGHDAGADLVAMAGDDGILFTRGLAGLAAWGVALRVPAQAAGEALAAVGVDDAVGLPGCGPVVMGALPFAGTAGADLVIPQVLVGRDHDGTAWRTTVHGTGEGPDGPGEAGEAGARGGSPRGPQPPAAVPDEFSLYPVPPHDVWRAAVRAAVAEITAGKFHKVVLSRQVVVEANRPIRPSAVLARLRALYPSCMLFSVDGFVGASPELLVARRADLVRSEPLAGTIPRSGDPEVDARLGAELLASAKDRAEHRFVVEAVAAALAPYCQELDVPTEPSLVPLRNVSHLGTRLAGTLRPGGPTALELALALHPTPAVAGSPTAAAMAYLAHAEAAGRGFYAGPVGWTDRNGNGDWAVGIRCAQLEGPRARLYAGAGVVADSSPDDELVETQLKLQALLAAVVRP